MQQSTKTSNIRSLDDHIRFSRLTPEEVVAQWDDLEPYLRQLVARSEDEFVWELRELLMSEDLRAYRVRRGSRMLGLVLLNLNLTHFRTYLNIYGIVGRDLNSWIDKGLSRARDMAKRAGYDGVRCCCRPGLVPLLKARGFKVKHTVMEIST